MTTDYDEPKFDIGHVVILVRGELVDLACEQFSRPEHNIILPPSLRTPVAMHWIAGDEWRFLDLEDVRIGYQARPNDRRFEKREGYQLDPRNRTLVAEVVQQLAEDGIEEVDGQEPARRAEK